MITFGSLITGNFESEADREAAPFLAFLLFPVIAPLTLTYYTGVGTYKLGHAIKEHNPVKFYRDRRNSIKKLKEMADMGVNPFIDTSVKYYSKTTKKKENIIAEKQILMKTKEELEKYKKDSYKPNEHVDIYPKKKIEYKEVLNDKCDFEYIAYEKTVISHKTDFSKKPNQLVLKRKK